MYEQKQDLHAEKKCKSSRDSGNVYIFPLVIIYSVAYLVTALDLSYHNHITILRWYVCLQCVYSSYMSCRYVHSPDRSADDP